MGGRRPGSFARRWARGRLGWRKRLWVEWEECQEGEKQSRGVCVCVRAPCTRWADRSRRLELDKGWAEGFLLSAHQPSFYLPEFPLKW